MKRMIIGVMAAVAVACPAEEEFGGKVYWGVMTRKVPAGDYPELAHLAPGDMVSLVTLVAPGATGEAEGLRRGDVIVSAFGKSAVEFDFTIISGLYADSPEREQLRAGAIIPVEVLRTNEDDTRDSSDNLSQRRRGAERNPDENVSPSSRLRASARGTRSIVPLSLRVSRYYDTDVLPFPVPQTKTITESFDGFVSENWKAALPLLEERGLMEDFCDLTNRIAKADFYTDPYRLGLVRYVMRNPLMLEPVARLFRNILGGLTMRTKASAWDPWILGMTSYCFMTGNDLLADDFFLGLIEKFSERLPEISRGDDLNMHLDYIERVLEECASLNRQAFAAITPEEQAFVLKYRDEFIESFLTYKMLSYERDTEKTRRALEIFRILNKIEMPYLYAQYIGATRLADEFFTDSLLASLEGRDIAVPVVAHRDTPYGSIVIGGTGNDTYAEDIAVLYELGGNDQYFNNQGASVPGKIPTSVFVDFAGDDAYESTDVLTQGAGNFGVGILVDKKGNDTYAGMRLVQGAAFGGIGALFDHEGDDIYRSIACSQAVAFFGAAILCDYAGNDRYESHQIAQAVGSVKGVAILADMGGNNSFYCKGDRQTSYGTRGHFEGWGQGVGFGVRPYAS
ncbi:MAG: hypothetical protein FWF84_07475, partial [Kiritimatiellaeota bacterium]|nr:hypothetical protein [Kiritimatiellota bacterium]